MQKFIFKISILFLLFTLLSCSTKNKTPVIDSTKKEIGYPTYLTPFAKLPLHTTIKSIYSSKVYYKIVDYQQLPEWSNQYFEQSLQTFKKSCQVLIAQPKWNYVCQVAAQTQNTRQNARRFFEEHFQPWSVTNNSGGLSGKVTGYYEPAIRGSTTKSDQYSYPIYGTPTDLVSIPLPQNLINFKGTVHIQKSGNNNYISASGPYFANLSKFYITPKTTALKGRFLGQEFIPYYTRKEIYQGALNNTAPVLAYANDPVELFFLQVQGSGRIITDDHKMIRLAYADKNEFPYQSIGTYMAQKGYLPLNQINMPNIKDFIQKHPAQKYEILSYNPSYVFFKISETNEHNGPIGALGVPLTNGYSGAVDKHYIDLGAPLFLATTDTRTGKALNRLIVAQDTGSAINGSVRVDFFWGYGLEAGEIAGKTNYPGYVWILLPNGQYPIR